MDRAYVGSDGAFRVAQVLPGQPEIIARSRVRRIRRDGLLESLFGHLKVTPGAGLVALSQMGVRGARRGCLVRHAVSSHATNGGSSPRLTPRIPMFNSL